MIKHKNDYSSFNALLPARNPSRKTKLLIIKGIPSILVTLETFVQFSKLKIHK